jgi:catecholate siderophore receptor
VFAQQAETVLPQVKVEGLAERADGPVQGYRAERSSTFTKTDTPLKDVPASVSVVPGEVMKDAAMQSLADVFRYVPGALAHQGEGNRDQIILRGISTTADFYINGVRDDAQVFRDLYNLERVEVLKGPAGMAFGRGGAGGVVNRVTRRADFAPVGEASLTIGSYSQLRGTLDVGGKLNDSTAWRLNAMAEGADTFRDGASLNRWAINPTATFVLGTNTLLTVDFEHLRDDRTADRGFPSRNGAPLSADAKTFFGNASQSNALSTVNGMGAVLEHEFAGGTKVKNAFRATHYNKSYQNVYPGSAVSAAGFMTLSAYNNLNQRQNVFNQTDFTKKIMFGGFEHSLLGGFEFGAQDSINKRNTGFFGAATGITASASNPYAVATSFRPNTTDADNKVRADIAAVYVQDQITLSRDWKALLGLRFDHFKVAFDDRRTLVAPGDVSRTDNGLSPRAGLIWTPTAVSTYYVSYSYAFLPSAEQLGLAVTTASLAPEKAKNYEVGARWDLMPKLTLSAAVFRTDRDDVRVADPANPGYFLKTGQQRTEGVEMGLQGEITRTWQVYGGFAFLNGRIMSPVTTASTTPDVAGAVIPAGARLQLVPQRTLSVWNRFSFGDGWGAGLGLIHQSEAFASVSNAVQLPKFWRADGAVYYAFNGGRTRLALNVENLFDKKYFPTVDGDNNISPGAPRNARVTLTTRF